MQDIRVVGIAVEHDLTDRVLLDMVHGFGHPAVLCDVDLPGGGTTPPAVLVVRSLERLVRISGSPWGDRATVIAMDSPGNSFAPAPGVDVVPDTVEASDHLKALLEYRLGAPRRRSAPPLSSRELEILTTYVLGATVQETAARHFVATSTVRTHYRRVASKYAGAGRPVGNKAHLLLQMVADGLIQLPDGFPEIERRGACAV
ncbi:LuxR C-terminal-related transcriptional regulator [Gordonia caeni]|uniref:HTH luxR-type domain-containing protein n=1 Tax=Gordonia caeni TaxID=1007097 RepID=A0ABP7NKM7_9ACTN